MTLFADWVAADAYSGVADPAPVGGGTYYVAVTGGNDAGVGSLAEPWATVRNSLPKLKPGDTLVLLSGTHSLTYGWMGSLVGTESAPITIDATLATVELSSPGPAILWIRDSAWVRIKGGRWTMTAARQDAHEPAHGIIFQRAHHVRVEGTTVEDCGATGIGAIRCDHVAVVGNTVRRCCYWNETQTSGISLFQSRDFDLVAGPHNLISGNTVEDCLTYVGRPGDGLITDGNGIIVDDNRNLWEPPDWQIPYQGQTAVSGNTCVRNGGSGVKVFQSSNVRVFLPHGATGNGLITGDPDLKISASINVSQPPAINRTDTKRAMSLREKIKNDATALMWSNSSALALEGTFGGIAIFAVPGVISPQLVEMDGRTEYRETCRWCASRERWVAAGAAVPKRGEVLTITAGYFESGAWRILYSTGDDASIILECAREHVRSVSGRGSREAQQ